MKTLLFPQLLDFHVKTKLPPVYREVPNARLFCFADLEQSPQHMCYTVVNPQMNDPISQHQQCEQAVKKEKDKSKAAKVFMENTVDHDLREAMWITQFRSPERKVYGYQLGRIVVWMYFATVNGVAPAVLPPTVDNNDSERGHDWVHETTSEEDNFNLDEPRSHSQSVNDEAAQASDLNNMDLLPNWEDSDLLLNLEDSDLLLNLEDSDSDWFPQSDNDELTPAASNSSEGEDDYNYKRTRLT